MPQSSSTVVPASWLAALGLVGYVSLLAGSVLELYGLELRLLHNLPDGLFALLLPRWRIVRGFRSTALAAAHGGSTQGEPGLGRRVQMETSLRTTVMYNNQRRPTVNSDDLQQTLYNLMQSGSRSNPAYHTLLHDYTTYHVVLVIEGGLFALLLIVLSVSFWRRFQRTQKAETHSWTFEKKAYFCFGLVSTVVSCGMLLLVAANSSNALHPQAGFAQSIPDLGTPQAGTPKAALYQAVTTWAQSSTTAMPSLLEDGVRNRLAWQRPKAIVCSILLVALAVFTARVWRKLLHARSRAAAWSLKEKALFIMGVLAVPTSLLLMIMALANTQASFAPITLTLLFS